MLTSWRCVHPHWVPQKPLSFPVTQGLVTGGNLSRFVQAAKHSVELFPRYAGDLDASQCQQAISGGLLSEQSSTTADKAN